MKGDMRAPDGLVATGERIVRKGGRVKFAKCWWTDERLKGMEGQIVIVSAEDYHYSEISIADSGWNFMFTIKADWKAK